MKLGSDPALFWQPWLGAHFGYRPHEAHLLADVLIRDYVAMFEWVRAASGGGDG